MTVGPKNNVWKLQIGLRAAQANVVFGEVEAMDEGIFASASILSLQTLDIFTKRAPG